MPTGLRPGEEVKTGFHYRMGDYVWYRQDSDHWVEVSKCAYVSRYETWLLVEEDHTETDVGEGGIKNALRYASEVLKAKQIKVDTEINSRVRSARRSRLATT